MSAEAPQLVPGTVQAIRAWDLVPEAGSGRVLLGSIAQSMIWPQGTITAECVRPNHLGDGPPPGPGCDCGIYAFHRHELEDDFLSEHAHLDEVVGVIDAWGRIEVHESGIRAQHARVSALLVDADAPEGYLRRAARAAATYRAEIVPLSPNRFAAYLADEVRGLDEVFIERLLLADRRLALEPLTVSYISRRGEAVGGFGFVWEEDPTPPKRFQKRVQIGTLGGEVVRVVGSRHHPEALQRDAFAPGRAVALVPEPDNPHDPDALAIWDAERSCRVGYIPREHAAAIRARLASGRIAAAHAVWQWRDLRTGLRAGLHILISATPDVEFLGGEQLAIA